MKRYFIWADKNCNGENVEWKELTGAEFYEFVNSPESEGRYIVHYKDHYGECDEAFWETTKEDYMKWDRERHEEKYRNQIKAENPVEFVSLDEILYYDDNGDPVTLADSIPSSEDGEDEMILKLREAIKTLSPEEVELINLLFLENNENLSERKIAEQLGIPQKTLNNRKLIIFKKIKNKLAQN